MSVRLQNTNIIITFYCCFSTHKTFSNLALVYRAIKISFKEPDELSLTKHVRQWATRGCHLEKHRSDSALITAWTSTDEQTLLYRA